MAIAFSTEWWLEQIALSKTKEDTASQVIAHGQGLAETWTGLAYQKEPEPLFDKIVWWAGVISQLVISTFTFPAALGAFLLEESAQAGGMGGYLLYTSKSWEPLATYIKTYQTALETFSAVASNLALVNPIAGGAVIIYMEQAKLSSYAMENAMINTLRKEARALGIPNVTAYTAGELVDLIAIAESEKAAQAIIDAQTYGAIALKSLPTNANITLDSVETGLQTPETFKRLTAGPHGVTVSRWNPTTQTTDSFATTITVIAGIKKEVTLHIPKGSGGGPEPPEDPNNPPVPVLPPFITTTVTCAKCLDGDTFETVTGERVRILGMDAPETGQPIAAESKAFMEGKLVDHSVTIKIQTHLPIDTYGRTLAIASYRDENVAVSSIANGLAKAYILSDARYDPIRYTEAEALAKSRQVGIWNPSTPPIIWRGY